MINLSSSAETRNSFRIFRFVRPRIERELDGEGWLVRRGPHGWLCGDRRQALAEFRRLERIERRGRA